MFNNFQLCPRPLRCRKPLGLWPACLSDVVGISGLIMLRLLIAIQMDAGQYGFITCEWATSREACGSVGQRVACGSKSIFIISFLFIKFEDFSRFCIFD